MRRPLDLDLHLGIGNRSAEVILRDNFGLDFFAEHHGLVGRGDGDFELRLLVLLNAERTPSAGPPVIQRDRVGPERRALGKFVLALDATELVGRQHLLRDLGPLRVLNQDLNLLICERRLIGLVVL